MNCSKCYYRGTQINSDKSKYHSCDYILYTQESRNCEVETCDKFLEKKRDRNTQYGCGSCIHYDDVVCKVTGEEVWSYKPSCKAFYKKNERKAGTWLNVECLQKILY